MSRLLIRTLAALAALLAATLPAAADIGVGVGATPITLPSPALPGHRYQLPPLYVVNTGTEPSTIQIAIQAPRTGNQPVPAEWLEFGSNGFVLEAKASTAVPLTLVVPSGASSGAYRADLLVRAGRPDVGGTALGAGAIASLSFNVDAPPATPMPQPTAQPAGTPAPTPVSEPAEPARAPSPWLWYVAGAALLFVGIAAAARRLPVRLTLRRRVNSK